MKAAHRKELERNELANRLGRLATDIRKPMPRGMVFLIIGLLLVLGVLFIGWRVRVLNNYESAKRWVAFEDGYNEAIMELMNNHPTEAVGKAAKFQYAWIRLWELGIKKLAADPKSALSSIEEAKAQYTDLARDCKDDPVWEPEALYGLAIIEETRAVNSTKHLDAARDLYAEVVTKYPNSAQGQFAKDRAAKLKSGTETRKKIDEFYRELQFSLPQLRSK